MAKRIIELLPDGPGGTVMTDFYVRLGWEANPQVVRVSPGLWDKLYSLLGERRHEFVPAEE